MAQQNQIGLLDFMEEYERIERFTEDLLKVWAMKKCGVYSLRTSTLIIPCEFDEIRNHLDEHFRVRQGRKWGVYEHPYWTAGQLIVPVNYDEIRSLSPFWAVRSGKKWGLYSSELKREMLSPEYKAIQTQHGQTQRHFRLIKSSKWGLIDGNAAFLLPLAYAQIERLKENLYLVEKDGKFGVIGARKMNVLVPLEFDGIERVAKTHFRVRREGKYGIYYCDADKGSELRISIEYDSLEPVGDTLFRAKKGRKISMVSASPK